MLINESIFKVINSMLKTENIKGYQIMKSCEIGVNLLKSS